MSRPNKLAIGQVWKDEFDNVYIVFISPTGRNFRALNLTTMIAREWGLGNRHEPPSWATFVCILDGKDLLNKDDTGEL